MVPLAIVGRRPEHHEHQLFFDLVEMMGLLRRHEQERARLDRVVLTADSKLRPASNREVNLVLVVRLLTVRAAGG